MRSLKPYHLDLSWMTRLGRNSTLKRVSQLSFTSDRGTKDLRGSGDEGGRGEEDACSRATGSGGGGELDTGIEEGGGA